MILLYLLTNWQFNYELRYLSLTTSWQFNNELRYLSLTTSWQFNNECTYLVLFSQVGENCYPSIVGEQEEDYVASSPSAAATLRSNQRRKRHSKLARGVPEHLRVSREDPATADPLTHQYTSNINKKYRNLHNYDHHPGSKQGLQENFKEQINLTKPSIQVVEKRPAINAQGN